MNLTKNLMAATLLMAASVASAQLTAPLDLEILFTGTEIAAANGTGGTPAAEPDGVAVTPDGNTIYLFDSIGAMDGILLWNGTALSTFATETQLAGASASAGDLAADATNVYTSIWDNTDQRIWRIPHAGGFASAVNMVDDSGALTDEMDEIAVDTNNSRLLISYTDLNGAVTENIVHVPLNATAATPLVLATETDIETALSTITGYVDDTGDDLNVTDMTVQSDGDAIISHGFSSNRQINGSLLRIADTTNAISVFRTADQIITAAGADPSLVDIGNVGVNVLPNDDILIVVPFTSDVAVLRPFIAVVSADGASQRQIGTDLQLLGHLTAPEQAALVPSGTFFRFDSKSTSAVDAAGDLYFFRQGNPTSDLPQSAVLKLSGVVASSTSDWMMY